eukprot:CAMPEP_0181109366 /NCGR_PEP_ID=MMETSP1071-20121207/18137_1 /TAXON_ID=35127 /ORGANISM="Thalassiosira sp., Strain NH16" /LENGTH=312 /DNA_ID=CAMNT_0023193055 /DNA_START=26 /DNA_END=964 /DNA_ORIENTATION=-
MASLRTAFFGIIWLVAIAVADVVDEELLTVRWINQMPDTTIELFWEGNDMEERRVEGTVHPRGGFVDVNSYEGHEFSYDLDGVRHYVTPPEPNPLGDRFAILAGDHPGFLVRCEISTVSETKAIDVLDLLVKPYWAPRGASRFLELVRQKYYDGVALNRVIPGFLTQFGIGKDYEARMHWESHPIADDFLEVHDFEPGYVSFAGSGPDSRTTEVFIVMPETPQEQLDYFGTNSWETPFAVLQGDVGRSGLTRIYHKYGDMPPWGEGPDSSRIYEVDGYDYLAEEFPKLDYMNRCYIVDEEGLVENNVSEEEL